MPRATKWTGLVYSRLAASTLLVAALAQAQDVSFEQRPELAVADSSFNNIAVLINNTPPHGFTEGAAPFAGLVQASDGVLYGSTLWGSTFNRGSLFQLLPDGTGFSTLHVFAGAPTDGDGPDAVLIQGTDGALYGTTVQGGSDDGGTVFRLLPDGSDFTLLHSFTNPDGLNPYSGIVQASDGTLYGQGVSFEEVRRFQPGGFLATGDFNGDGRLDLAVAGGGGNVSLLLGNGDGSFQPARDIPAGDFTGSIVAGDFNGDGVLDLAVVTGIDAARGVSVLLGNGDGSFQPARHFETGFPTGSMVAGDFNGDGVLDLAVVTGMDPARGVSVLLGNGDGGFQVARHFEIGGAAESIAVGDFNGDGVLDVVVTALPGGVSVILGNGDGTFQAARHSGGERFLASVAVGDFNHDGKLDLAAPVTSQWVVVVLLGNGDGSFREWGSFSTQREPLSIAVGDFNGDGRPDLAWSYFGQARPIVPSAVTVCLGGRDVSCRDAGTFYLRVEHPVRSGPIAVGDFNGDGRPDMAIADATNSVAVFINNTPPHDFTEGAAPFAGLVQASDGVLYGSTLWGSTFDRGSLFRLLPDGTGYRTLHVFAGAPTDGDSSNAALIQGLDGALYGTTVQGGSDDGGTVFRLLPDGSGFTLLHSFTNLDGLNPYSGIVQASDGTLYGTTSAGGAFNVGTVFSLLSDGSGFTVLHNFAGMDGVNSYAGLIVASDGSLYGTTSAGGAYGLGTVFRLLPDGSDFTRLHTFAGLDGGTPYAGLVQASDGALYGTTVQGGASGVGAVFGMSPDGSGFRVLHSFQSDGEAPIAALNRTSDGSLYGTTFYGGCGSGAVFWLNPDGSSFAVLVCFGRDDYGANPYSGLIQSSEGFLYGTTTGGGAGSSGTVFRLQPDGRGIESLRSFPIRW